MLALVVAGAAGVHAQWAMMRLLSGEENVQVSSADNISVGNAMLTVPN